MHQDIESLLKNLPKFKASTKFADQLEQQLLKELSPKPAHRLRFSLLFSIPTIIILFVAIGLTSLKHKQIPVLTPPPQEGKKFMAPNAADRTGDNSFEKSETVSSTTPCTQNTDQCDPNSCDFQKCQYVCPSQGWIDCKPKASSGGRYQCNQNYIDWAKKNCSDFEGVVN